MPNILTTQHAAAHNRRHQDAGVDEIDCAGLAGRVNYVDRGDPEVYDWVLSSLTANGTWYDLDCSHIVPADAIAIRIQVALYATTASKYMRLRKKGNSYAINSMYGVTAVASVICPIEGIVACDQNRVIQYVLQAATWGSTGITIRGWFI